jgi:hypothetical protein
MAWFKYLLLKRLLAMEKTLAHIPKMLTDQHATAKVRFQKGVIFKQAPYKVHAHKAYPPVLLPPPQHGYIKPRKYDCL